MCLFESQLRYELGLFEEYADTYPSEWQKLERYLQWIESQPVPNIDDLRTFFNIAKKVFAGDDLWNQLSDLMPSINNIIRNMPDTEEKRIFLASIGDLSKDPNWVRNTARLGYRHGMSNAWQFSNASDVEKAMLVLLDGDSFNVDDAISIIKNNEEILGYINVDILKEFIFKTKEEANRARSGPGITSLINSIISQVNNPPDYPPDDLPGGSDPDDGGPPDNPGPKKDPFTPADDWWNS